MEGLPRGGRTRLAPTPSGYLHQGNALNFLLTERLARSVGARILLRIDDLDTGRMRMEYLEDVFRSLEWLGITWDEGPSGPDDLLTQWSQRFRVRRYLDLADALRGKGVLYGCTCGRSMFRGQAPDGRYPGTCREKGLPMDAPDTAWRYRVEGSTKVSVPAVLGTALSVDLAVAMGDPVLRTRHGLPAYQLASLADDEDHAVTFVVRGQDLMPSTACQVHLAHLLALPGFQRVRFLHHPLVCDAQGRKLSKSEGATSLRAVRESGQGPDVLRARADVLLEEMLRTGS